MNRINNSQKNALNYKIVKCKNWEKDKTCKYGAHCTFAHGDEEIRNKNDNLYQMQPGMGLMMQPFMFDMNAIMQLGQMNQLQEIDINKKSMNPMILGISLNNFLQQQKRENNINQNEEEKKE